MQKRKEYRKIKKLIVRNLAGGPGSAGPPVPGFRLVYDGRGK
ncbi:hypothetical protein NC653_015116 [Populus alba x Populus x berolinensis]|uniref:Uncharacterized protein n=1 Tax=Populus alba x Populus x berolinensis TaxID=444605 RepID=A0AAD6QZ42_9ROSI|nr:hypothetical protein NC653_015116 [Populus alba x Populus x berolinensis]